MVIMITESFETYAEPQRHISSRLCASDNVIRLLYQSRTKPLNDSVHNSATGVAMRGYHEMTKTIPASFPELRTLYELGGCPVPPYSHHQYWHAGPDRKSWTPSHEATPSPSAIKETRSLGAR